MNRQKYAVDKLRDLADQVAEQSIKNEYPLEYQRTLHLIRQHDLVGTMIAKAVEKGDFDNLEGAGQPISLVENPFEPEDMRMLHKILKDNGYAPHWIELGKEIDLLHEKLGQEVEHFKKYTRIVYREKHSSRAMRRFEHRKNAAYEQFRQGLEAISNKILDYNLNCPVLELRKANISLEHEMNRIVQEINHISPDLETNPGK